MIFVILYCYLAVGGFTLVLSIQGGMKERDWLGKLERTISVILFWPYVWYLVKKKLDQ